MTPPRAPDGLRSAGDRRAGDACCRFAGRHLRTICVYARASAVEEFRNQLRDFATLLFNFDASIKSAKKPTNSQKSRLIKVILGGG
jgi:hypothetical protein